MGLVRALIARQDNKNIRKQSPRGGESAWLSCAPHIALTF